MTTFILSELRVYRLESYLDKRRPLKGKIKFESNDGEVSMNLNERLSRRIVELCAEELAESAAEIADHMRSDALTVNVLTAPPKE